MPRLHRGTSQGTISHITSSHSTQDITRDYATSQSTYAILSGSLKVSRTTHVQCENKKCDKNLKNQLHKIKENNIKTKNQSKVPFFKILWNLTKYLSKSEKQNPKEILAMDDSKLTSYACKICTVRHVDSGHGWPTKAHKRLQARFFHAFAIKLISSCKTSKTQSTSQRDEWRQNGKLKARNIISKTLV